MDIMDLGQDTYLVGRKVIKADVPSMFDLSLQADRDELCRIAKGLYTGHADPACFDVLTVCVLRPASQESLKRFPGTKYEEDQMHFSELHDGAREALRKEFPDHAGEI